MQQSPTPDPAPGAMQPPPARAPLRVPPLPALPPGRGAQPDAFRRPAPFRLQPVVLLPQAAPATAPTFAPAAVQAFAPAAVPAYTPPPSAPPVPAPALALAPPAAPAPVAMPAPAMHAAEHAAPLLSPHFEPIALEQTPFLRAMDVLGGTIFTILVGLIMVNIGSLLFYGSGWAISMGWETVWIMTALLCAPLMPSGIVHDISMRSTLFGIKLDLPELVIPCLTLYQVMQTGVQHGWFGPLGYALSVGAAEEIVFRVLLLGWLITRLETAPALLVSSAVFGLAHMHELSLVGVMSVVPQFSGGLLLGAIYLRTRNPIGPILCHAAWDFPIFLALGNGVSGGGTEAGMPSVGSVLFWLLFGVYGLWLVRHGVPAAGRHEPITHTVA